MDRGRRTGGGRQTGGTPGQSRHAVPLLPAILHPLLSLLLALAGCGGAGLLDSPYAGLSADYEPGLPNFDFLAVASVEDGQSGVNVYASLPPASLVFTRTDSSYLARFDLAFRVLDMRGREAVTARVSADTLEAASAEATQAFEPVLRVERIPLGPGRYVVEASVEDAQSGRRAVRLQRVEVVPPGEGPALGAIVLEGGQPPAPVVSLHLPTGLDSLRAVAEVHAAPPGASALAELFRLEADTAVAYPPFWIQPLRGSLRYRGVNMDVSDADTLLVRPLPLAAAPVQDLAVELPGLGRGVYLVRLRLRDASGEPLAEAARAFTVQGAAYPRLATLDDLIDALAYIAYPRELSFIRAGETAYERRLRFDAFWGALVPDRRVAENLLQRYYERIEEANVLFASHQPGWKTDRGMIYVVFGAPEYVEQTLEAEVWHYGYGANDATGVFVFERADAAAGGESPFAQYVLVRRPAYERAWVEAIRRWRAGEVL